MRKLLVLMILLAGCSGQRADRAHSQGHAYANKKQWKEASEHYARAVKLDPAVPKYHYNLAVSLTKRGLYEQAAMEASEALRLDPGYERASILLSQLGSAIERRDGY